MGPKATFGGSEVASSEPRAPKITSGGRSLGGAGGIFSDTQTFLGINKWVSINIPPGPTGTPRDPPDAPAEPYNPSKSSTAGFLNFFYTETPKQIV